MQKQALDQAAKDYWTKYFAEYGKMWVRDVPRRMKQAVKRSLKAESLEGEIVPMAKFISNGSIAMETALVGTIEGKPARVLVAAAFDAEGRMTAIDINRVT